MNKGFCGTLFKLTKVSKKKTSWYLSSESTFFLEGFFFFVIFILNKKMLEILQILVVNKRIGGKCIK